MGRRGRRECGQAAVEMVGVAIVLGVLTLVGWQAVLAAYAWQTAQGAARTAARAGSVGAPVERAALAALPGHLARRATVRSEAVARDGACAGERRPSPASCRGRVVVRGSSRGDAAGREMRRRASTGPGERRGHRARPGARRGRRTRLAARGRGAGSADRPGAGPAKRRSQPQGAGIVRVTVRSGCRRCCRASACCGSLPRGRPRSVRTRGEAGQALPLVVCSARHAAARRASACSGSAGPTPPRPGRRPRPT